MKQLLIKYLQTRLMFTYGNWAVLGLFLRGFFFFVFYFLERNSAAGWGGSSEPPEPPHGPGLVYERPMLGILTVNETDDKIYILSIHVYQWPVFLVFKNWKLCMCIVMQADECIYGVLSNRWDRITRIGIHDACTCRKSFCWQAVLCRSIKLNR